MNYCCGCGYYFKWTSTRCPECGERMDEKLNEKKHAHLIRYAGTDEGTCGVFVSGSLLLWTIELPWQDNKRNVSCIPTGKYTCIFRISKSKGDCYHVLDVPDRDSILFHVANWAGDISKGFKSDVQGCIGIGTYMTVIDGQIAVANSRQAMKKLIAYMKKEPFELRIIDVERGRV